MKRAFAEWIQAVDRILRGEATRLRDLRTGTIDVPLGGLATVIVLLGMIYGACMGVYALLRADGPGWIQLVASMIKVPVLFYGTLAVTFPSLYVFNALVGSRLTLKSLLNLLIASLAVNLAVLSSLGPVVGFFSVSTTSHPFMVLLNVLVFAVSGILGLSFLLQTLHRLSIVDRMWPVPEPVEQPPASEGTAPQESQEATGSDAGPLERVTDHLLGNRVKAVFGCWIIVFGLVGAQMSWILRPFIGSPDAPFTWFREREGNFFQDVFRTIWELL